MRGVASERNINRQCPRGYSGSHFERRFRPRSSSNAASPSTIAGSERRTRTLPSGLARLVVGVAATRPHDLGQVDILGHRRSIAVGAGEGEELADHLFIRVPSASMRLRWFSASGPAFRRASSTATCSRASGDAAHARCRRAVVSVRRRADAVARPSRRSRARRRRFRRGGGAPCRPHAR